METERRAGAKDSGGTGDFWRLWGYKSHGVPWFGILLRGTSLGCFCVTTPWINDFMEWDIWDLPWETWGWTGEETWSEWGVWGVKWGPIGSLEPPTRKWLQSQQWKSLALECDQHSCVVRLGSSLSKKKNEVSPSNKVHRFSWNQMRWRGILDLLSDGEKFYWADR